MEPATEAEIGLAARLADMGERVEADLVLRLLAEIRRCRRALGERGSLREDPE